MMGGEYTGCNKSRASWYVLRVSAWVMVLPTGKVMVELLLVLM